MRGAIIGDIVGSVYEWHNIKTKDFPLLSPDSFFTDDTVMTGWRVGYVMADAPIREKMQVAHQYDVVSVGSFLQPACVEALHYDNAEALAIFRRRRDYVHERLTGMGLSVQKPEGAFYMLTCLLAIDYRFVNKFSESERLAGELSKINCDLDAKVAKRTAELQEANAFIVAQQRKKQDLMINIFHAR